MKTGKHWQDIFDIAIKETDVVIEVLDSRNPLGTHNTMIEKFLLKNRPDIEIVLILNKSDIIPLNILNGWKDYFKSEGYTAYSVSAKYHRGVMNLLQQIRKFGTHNKTNILIVGYPNTGKSTLIESLTKNEKKLGTSSNAGFTRAIQKIKLTNNIFLIDTPGIIPFEETNETEMAMKACMIADKLVDPMAVVEAVYKLLPKKKFEKLYKISLEKEDGPEELIFKIGKKHGKLIAGGKVNESEVQKVIIRDFQSNRLRYYTIPPSMQKKQNQPQIEEETPKNISRYENMPPSLKKRKK
jgi:nuclear GTP-binding protein